MARATQGTRIRNRHAGRKTSLGEQLLLQVVGVLIGFVVLFPILWVVTMSLDPRNISRPRALQLIPHGASLGAYRAVLDRPTSNDVPFWRLALNSLVLSGGVAFVSVGVAVLAAYAFSRRRFPGRRPLMLLILFVLLAPNTAGLAPLFVLLSHVKLGELGDFNLRESLYGVGLALVSGALPFSIWNLKGYIDTIPKELEEAALVDGATPSQIFLRIILPLSTPALAVTAFISFTMGWTEFGLSWAFLNKPKDFTLSMALWTLTGPFSSNIPWSRFAAMALLVSAPVSIVYLLLQRYIVGGLTVGGVKG